MLASQRLFTAFISCGFESPPLLYTGQFRPLKLLKMFRFALKEQIWYNRGLWFILFGHCDGFYTHNQCQLHGLLSVCCEVLCNVLIGFQSLGNVLRGRIADVGRYHYEEMIKIYPLGNYAESFSSRLSKLTSISFMGHVRMCVALFER